MKKIISLCLVIMLILGCSVSSAASSVRVGQTVYFGRYYYTANTYMEDLAWTVIAVEGDKALLITKYGIDRDTMNATSTWTQNGRGYYTQWDNCRMREWLNGNFYWEAFNYNERSAICETYLDNSRSTWMSTKPSNRTGIDTYDNVFLLSYSEYMRYLPGRSERRLQPSRYTKSRGCSNKNGYTWYWTRTPSYNNNFIVVDETGNFDSCYMSHGYGVIRPAVWVKISAL